MTDIGTFAYVACAESREIHVFRLDVRSGEVTSVQQIAVTGKVMPMAVSPDRRFLFAALRSEPYAVASFAIDRASGKLTHLANAPLAASMAYISTDRTGRFLFGASTLGSIRQAGRSEPSGEIISVNPIGLHGFIQPPSQIVRTGPKMHAILSDPSNRYVFATSCDGDFIARQIFDLTAGMLLPDPKPAVRIKPKAGPRHFVFHPNNRLLYLLNETDASIYVFDYDAGPGTLREIQIVSTLPANVELDKEHPNAHAADLHLTPDGTFLYASVRVSNTLSAFRVNLASGLLTPIDSFPTEKGPRAFNIDPSGCHLLALGGETHSMVSYSINPETGNLTKPKHYATGKYPNWIEIIRLC